MVSCAKYTLGERMDSVVLVRIMKVRSLIAQVDESKLGLTCFVDTKSDINALVG